MAKGKEVTRPKDGLTESSTLWRMKRKQQGVHKFQGNLQDNWTEEGLKLGQGVHSRR